MKVESFATEKSICELEKLINRWLGENKDKEVLFVSHSVATHMATALVFYKDIGGEF